MVKMKIENPFSDATDQIEAKYFIGREKEIGPSAEIPRNIDTSIFREGVPSDLALIGIPGIGKSSLVHKAITERKKELNKKKVLPIGITVYHTYNQWSFFNECVVKCAAEMKILGCCIVSIQKLLDSLKETLNDKKADISLLVQSFFKEVKQTEWHPLFILDKFDNAQVTFKSTNAFGVLNDLITNQLVSLVLIARQDIEKIENNADSGSPFGRRFRQPMRLSMFSETDLETYFSKFPAVHGISIDEEKIRFYSGAHPYLLQALGFQIVNRFSQTNEIDIDRSFKDISETFVSYYRKLANFLEQASLFDSLLQVLSGVRIPRHDLEVLGEDQYGLIKKAENGDYTAFSEHFENYLKKEYSTPPAPTPTPPDLTRPVSITFILDEQVPFEEGLFCEFKEVTNSNLNPWESIKRHADEYAVAFLNCKGGSIFWGINDEKKVVGVKLAANCKTKDDIQKLVTDKFSHIGNRIDATDYELVFHQVYNKSKELMDDLWVIQLVLKPQGKDRFFNMPDRKFFIKNHSGHQILSGTDIHEFIEKQNESRSK